MSSDTQSQEAKTIEDLQAIIDAQAARLAVYEAAAVPVTATSWEVEGKQFTSYDEADNYCDNEAVEQKFPMPFYSGAVLKPLLEDARRYHQLKAGFLAADFDYQESGESVLVFEFKGRVSANLDRTLDDADIKKQVVAKTGPAL